MGDVQAWCDRLCLYYFQFDQYFELSAQCYNIIPVSFQVVRPACSNVARKRPTKSRVYLYTSLTLAALETVGQREKSGLIGAMDMSEMYDGNDIYPRFRNTAIVHLIAKETYEAKKRSNENNAEKNNAKRTMSMFRFDFGCPTTGLAFTCVDDFRGRRCLDSSGAIQECIESVTKTREN